MNDGKETTQVTGQDNAQEATLGMSRRAMLVGVSKAAVPAVITLYSGASLARSSNLIGVGQNQGAEQGKYRCLDATSVYPTENKNIYDLGQDPMAHVTRIDAYKKYYGTDWRGNVTGQQVGGNTMCATGGQYYRSDWGTYKKVTVRKGMLVSATALASFANDITYTDV